MRKLSRANHYITSTELYRYNKNNNPRKRKEKEEN